MATSIFFDGRVISVPGAYSEIDASGLESVGLSASGIVAVLGTAEGGIPVSAAVKPTDLQRFGSPEKMQKTFRSGQLREAASMLFAPMKDSDIQAGAQTVVALKVNPSTQATGSLKASGVPQIDLTSRDYGAFTNQINVHLQDGSVKGKLLTISFEDTVEVIDNLGGDPEFTLEYSGGSYGYNTALASVNAAGDISVTATRAALGLSSDISNPVTNAAVEIVGVDQTGTSPTVSAPVGTTVTVTGLSGITAGHVNHRITFASFTNSANNGAFNIASVVSSTSVTIINGSGVSETGSGGVSWTISDAGTLVNLYGLSGGIATHETIVHDGTNVVAGVTVWDSGKLMACVVDKAIAAGTLTVRIASAGATVFTLFTGNVSRGAIVCQNCYVDNTTVQVKLSGSGTPQVLVFGRVPGLAEAGELLTMSGVTQIPTSLSYAFIDVIAVGLVSTTRTLTLTARAAVSHGATGSQDTLVKVKTYFDSRKVATSGGTRGFIFTFKKGSTSFRADKLDIVSNVNIEDPTIGSFYANLATIIAWINQNSQLVSAAESTGATTMPDNTSSLLFLTGGTEGVALFADYQAALNLLKRVRVNTVVDLSGDPAVAAAVDAHCAFMGGFGKSERDATVGLLNDDMDDVPTKAQAKAQVVDINSRHIRAFAQAVTRFNTAGEKTEFLPPYLGAIAAGAQAGSPVGTSLTHKYANVLDFRQHSTWNPTDDSEEMITSGLCFLENVEGVGRRFVRNVTTHLSSNNIAFIEASVNNAVNFAAFNFRSAMEFVVGKRGFAGTLAAARSTATHELGLLVDDAVLTKYRALTMSLAVDVLSISVEMAPVIPINFVPITIHLATLAQAA